MPRKKSEPKKVVLTDDNIKAKKAWRKKIVLACKKAGTYNEIFDLAIDELADVLVMRDSAIKSYKENGNKAIIEHTNIGGKTNIVKNPAITLIGELTQLSLSYWRELGLTPKGFKALGAEPIQNNDSFNLEQFLNDLGI